MAVAAMIAALLPSPAAPAMQAADAPATAWSAQRLQRLDAFLTGATAPGGYLGAVCVVARDGRIVHHGAWGHRDLARSAPMREDAIFRIYSMSKPITSVAVLMLVEEGRVALDDPVARHLPEFADVHVLTGGSADAPQLARLRTPLTVRHLLTHSSGLAADSERHPVATTLLERADLASARDLADVARRLARVPLAEPPGTHFHYEASNSELLARIVEVAGGRPFAEFLQQRLFAPLRMRDTGFEVPPAQRGRVADLSTMAADGRLRLADTGSARVPGTRLNAYDSGAGGLYSTARDYLRFAQMLANDGELDGVRVLARKTVELMMRDQLATFDPPLAGMAPGEGFGLGGYVVTDVAARGRLGSEGQFGWSGAASTTFTVDRRERLVAILLLQHLPRQDGGDDLPRLATHFYTLVYQALP